jgi:hypothetical protein
VELAGTAAALLDVTLDAGVVVAVVVVVARRPGVTVAVEVDVAGNVGGVNVVSDPAAACDQGAVAMKPAVKLMTITATIRNRWVRGIRPREDRARSGAPYVGGRGARISTTLSQESAPSARRD